MTSDSATQSHGSAGREQDELAGYVQRHLKRNFAFLATDFGLFGLGMTFASMSTILPAFAEHLGATNLLIGAIPSVMTLGYALPPLFTANYTERLARKLPFILLWTIWERVPLIFLAIAAYFFASKSPGGVLIALLVVLATISGVGGALTPAWMDLIGKVIPTNLRGRLFAWGSTFAAGLGLVGAALAGYYLETFEFPLDYALCFATGFVFLFVSFFFLAAAKEPSLASSKPHVSLADYIRRLPEILRRDRNFTWYLGYRGLAVLGSLANGFYTVYALRTLGAPEWHVAQFTFVSLAAQTVANLIFGSFADRFGHKPVLVVGAAAALLGNLVAFFSFRVELVYFVFIFMAVATAAGNVSGLNIAMEFAPPADRPTYIGLGSTFVAPVAFISPLIGGLLADSVSYQAVFALAAVAGLIGALVLGLRVRDPRHARAS